MKLAKAGDPEAQCCLGLRYLRGDGVPASSPAAAYWLEKSALAGFVLAQCRLASLHLGGGASPASNGSSVSWLFQSKGLSKPDYHAAAHWARLAAETKSPDGLAILGFIYTSGPAEMRDPREGLICYKASARAGNAKGALGLGVAILGEEIPPPESLVAAREAFLQAAEGGEPLAHYYLGLICETQPDMAAALAYYRHAAQRGVVQAQARLGFLLLDGPLFCRNIVDGESWLRRAGNAGSTAAAVRIGDLYSLEGTLPPNYAEAIIWYQRAADNGDANAARTLGRLYLSSRAVGSNPAEAAEWLSRAVELGSRQAVGELGELLRSDKVAIQNLLVRALDCLKSRASSGEQDASLQLGLYFLRTTTSFQSIDLAAEYLRASAPYFPLAQQEYGKLLIQHSDDPARCAEARQRLGTAALAGMIDAQVLVGEMALNGRGGSKNPHEAASFFLMAAEKRHPGAMFALAAMLDGGHGIAPDADKAFFWLKQAAERGHLSAQRVLARVLDHDNNLLAACRRTEDRSLQSEKNVGEETEAMEVA